MHHPHRPRYHKSNHNQAPTTQPTVLLGHHTNKVELKRSDMVNRRSPKITIALGQSVNGSLDRKQAH
jgi:hypothetical protein